MTAAEAKALLRKVDRNYKEWRLRKDCRFVFGPLKEAIARLNRPRATAADRRLLVTAYCFLGDIFDFIDAPKAAIPAYRAAIRLDPTCAYAWSELGEMLNGLGQYRAALRALDTGIRLGDDDSCARWSREEAMRAIRERKRPEPCRPLGPVPDRGGCELLARNRPRAALKLLRGKRHPYLVQLRARAYGALGDAEGLLREWEGLRGTRDDVTIEVADWFFDPGGMWDMPRFWRALWAIRHRNQPGFGPIHDSMWKLIPAPRRGRGEADRRRHLRRHTLMLRYHLARTERDAAAARALARRYPQWPEAVALSRKLT